MAAEKKAIEKNQTIQFQGSEEKNIMIHVLRLLWGSFWILKFLININILNIKNVKWEKNLHMSRFFLSFANENYALKYITGLCRTAKSDGSTEFFVNTYLEDMKINIKRQFLKVVNCSKIRKEIIVLIMIKVILIKTKWLENEKKRKYLSKREEF